MNERPRLSLEQLQDVILTYEDRKRSVFEMPCVLCLGAMLKIQPLPPSSGDNWRQLRATCSHCGLVEIIPRSDHLLENPDPLREDGAGDLNSPAFIRSRIAGKSRAMRRER